MKTLFLLCAAWLTISLSTRSSERIGSDDSRRPHVDARQRFSAALGLQLIELSPSEGPGATGSKTVSGAIGVDDATLAGGDYYWGMFGASGEEQAIHLVRLPVAKVESAVAVVLALDEAGEFAAAAVVDANDTPLGAWSRLMSNLRFTTVPKLGHARPRSELARIRADAETMDSDDGRLTLALMDVVAHMHAQASSFNIPKETNPLSRNEQFAMIGEEYAHVAELTDALAPLLGSQADTFAEIGLESAAIATELATGEGQSSERGLFANCRRCHNLVLDEGMLKDVFKRVRTGLGIGEGYYQMGHDVRISHADREASQRVLDALRSAALLLEAAE